MDNFSWVPSAYRELSVWISILVMIIALIGIVVSLHMAHTLERDSDNYNYRKQVMDRLGSRSITLLLMCLGFLILDRYFN